MVELSTLLLLPAYLGISDSPTILVSCFKVVVRISH